MDGRVIIEWMEKRPLSGWKNDRWMDGRVIIEWKEG